MPSTGSRHLDEVEHRSVSYSPGEVIVAEGTTGDAVVLIAEGRAEVSAGGFDHPLAEMGAGDVIGEVAALAGGTRTATVRAATNLKGFLLERSAFEALLDLDEEFAELVIRRASARLERRHLLAFFERLFGHVGSEVIDEFERSVSWIGLEPGETVFVSGDPAHSAFFLVSGRVRELDLDEDGNDTVTREIARDELFGEAGLFRQTVRTTTAVATRSSRLVRIDRNEFLLLVNRHPGVLVPVVADLAMRPERRIANPRRAIGLFVAADLDGRVFVSRIVDQMSQFGTTAHVWAARVDAMLGREGVAQSSTSDPGEARLAELLHELELDHTYLVCEADRSGTEWTRRVGRQADILVAVIDSRLTEASIDQVDRFFRSGGEWSKRVVVVAHPADTKTPSGTNQLTGRWKPHDIYHIRAQSAADMARLARLLSGRAVSLVLGGGGARGFAHLGVYRAMAELDIPFDLVGGTSIGSPLAAGMALDISPAELVDIAAERFSGVLDYTVPVVSLVKGERITESIQHVFADLDIEDLWRPFFCVSTNLTRARAAIHTRGEVARAIRASVAIPGVIPPVAYGEDLHVDGGVLNNLPGDVMRRRNPTGTVIAVDVAPPVGPRAKGDPAMSVSGWQALRAKTGKQKTSYPGIAAILLRSMITASVRSRGRSLDRGDVDLYLDLDLRGISLLDFDNVRPVAQAGYEAAMPRLEAWLESQGRE